jgi:uncharacterized protein YgiM (DUF1202 family)
VIKILLEKFSISVVILCFLLATSPTLAEESSETVIKRDEWHADDNINTFSEDYNFPEKLTVVELNKKNFENDNSSDIKELYYYFATRSGFGDLPFHYIVLEDGYVFQGNKLKDEAKIALGGSEDSIFVAYVHGDAKQFSLSSVDPLKNVILEIINKYAIAPDNASIKSISFEFGERAKLENVELTDSSESWQIDMTILKEALKAEYNPGDITYKVELVESTVPSEELDPTTTVEAKIKVKNTGDYNIYSNLSGNIYVTRNNPFDERSSFYISSKWDSLSRVALLKEKERLASGEEKEFSFDIYVPLYPPERTEDFVLVDPKGNAISGTEFQVTLKIKSTDQKIIEITETPTGYLNVRETAGLGAVVTKVSPGDRFLVEDYQDGYYKIDVNGKEGWIVKTYAKEV